MMNAFDSNTPTVCVIVSPFQAICLASAIRNLAMSDYRVVVIDSDRNAQVANVLDRFGVDFEVKYVGRYRWRMRLYRLTSLFRRKNRYRRLVIGDFHSITLLYFGLQYVSDGSDIVYLDDGNTSIALFDGQLSKLPLGRDYKYVKHLSKWREICSLRYFYSIYTDIPNGKYVIKYNDLSVLKKAFEFKNNKKNVYIIGTNPIRYCEGLNVSRIGLYKCIENIIAEIIFSFSDANVIYIPHGKDTSEEIKSICSKYDVEYKRLEVPVEVFFLDEYPPVAIYGFTSSALYTLKKMFPDSSVYNFLPRLYTSVGEYIEYLSISAYYEKCGIELRGINLI